MFLMNIKKELRTALIGSTAPHSFDQTCGPGQEATKTVRNETAGAEIQVGFRQTAK